MENMRIFRKSETPLSQEEITEWLRSLRGTPFVPASGFDVTAVFRARIGDDDTYYYAGVNVENPHHRDSTHGEEGVIAAIATSLGKNAEIVEGWVMGAPAYLQEGDDSPLANSPVSCCGKCRQQIAGLAAPDTVIHSIALNGQHEETTVAEFLPNAFTFQQFDPDLIAAHTPEARRAVAAPSEEEAQRRLIRHDGELSQKDILDWLQELESVDFASKTSQAVIVRLTNGAYVAGVKVEEAAFVSMDAVQSAMAIAIAEFGNEPVCEVWSFAKGRDGHEIDLEDYTPLTLPGVQVLAQFAAHKKIPIHLVNGDGEQKDLWIESSGHYVPTFSQPTIKLGPERFVR